MKTHKVPVSHHQLTRCSSCHRHHHIDSALESAELLKLSCTFCDGQLIDTQRSTQNAARVSTWGGRSSKIAMGLLSASLTMSACDPDEEVVDSMAGEVAAGEVAAGEVAAGEVAAGEVAAGEVAAGEVAAGEVAAGEIAGVEIEAGAEAGVPVPPYGSFGAEEAGDMISVDMGVAGDEIPQPVYGAFPAGEEG